MTKTKAILLSALCISLGWFTANIEADDLGFSSRVIETVYTIPVGGTLTVTNSSPSGGKELWTYISACHTNDLTNNTVTIQRVADTGFEQDLWVSDPHTNDSVAVELITGRIVGDGDIITFSNSVTGEVTKVYVQKQQQ